MDPSLLSPHSHGEGGKAENSFLCDLGSNVKGENLSGEMCCALLRQSRESLRDGKQSAPVTTNPLLQA